MLVTALLRGAALEDLREVADVVFDPWTENEERKGGSYNFLEAGQVLANNTGGGGGGWGNPFERDPALVAKDVRNGFVSVEAAERDYGVAVDPATFSVDTARTATLRRIRETLACC